MALGATVGALSQTAEVLIVGRVFQGAGVAVMGIVATTVVSMYFPRAKAGRPMGIWNLWYVTGAALAYVIAVPVATWLGGSAEAWHAWWWFCAVCAYMALVVFAVFVKVPKVPKVTQRHSDLSKQNPKRAFGVVVEGFKEPRMWLLGLTFGFLMFTSLCVLSWVPTYVQDIETAKFIKEGMSAALAGEVAGADSGYLAALGFAASIPMSFITAYLLGKFTTIRARKIMLVVASALGYLYAFAFLIEFEWLPAWLVLLGIESGWTSGVVWSLVPMTMKSSRTIPTGFACIIAFQGLSNLLATPVVGYVIGSADVWTNVAPLCAASATIGVACCLVYALTGRPSSDKKQTSQKGFGLTFPVKNYRGKTAS
jgi:cyanate permease